MFTILSLRGVLLVSPVLILTAMMRADHLLLLLVLILVMILVACSQVWLMGELTKTRILEVALFRRVLIMMAHLRVLVRRCGAAATLLLQLRG